MGDNAKATAIDWQKMDGLLPAIVQDAASGQVLMLGYMNEEALKVSRDSGNITFYSRSKKRLWTKGESSGHFLKLVSAHLDCDGDALLLKATPIGPTCHLGTTSCWDDDQGSAVGFLAQLEQVIASRKGADASTSYTASLFAKGTKRIAQKVGEEGVETALAATAGDNAELLSESADLLYHLLVLLQQQGLSLAEVVAVLRQRHQR